MTVVRKNNDHPDFATLLYNMFRKLGHKCGLLSTVCNYIDGVAGDVCQHFSFWKNVGLNVGFLSLFCS